jgi:hypothetical protein
LSQEAKIDVFVDIDGCDFEAECFKELAAIVVVKDVVMQAAVIEVIERTLPEGFEGAGLGVALKVVLFEDLG